MKTDTRNLWFATFIIATALCTTSTVAAEEANAGTNPAGHRIDLTQGLSAFCFRYEIAFVVHSNRLLRTESWRIRLNQPVQLC